MESRIVKLSTLGGKITTQNVIPVGCILIISYLVLIPLGMLLIGSIRSAPIGEQGAHFTFKNYLKADLSPRFFPLLGYSFIYGFGRGRVSLGADASPIFFQRTGKG